MNIKNNFTISGKALFVLMCALSVRVNAVNLVPEGNFSEAKSHKVDWCRTEEGRFSLFNEEYSWNNCGKLEVTRARTNGTAVTRSAIVTIGRDGKFNGFAVKPDTNYDFSIDLRSDAARVVKTAGVRVMGWHGDNYWKDRSLIKVKSLSNISLESNWITYKGSFRTPSNVKRAALQVSIWSSSAQKLYDPGAYILFDNVKVEESVKNFNSPATAQKFLKIS